MGSIRIISPKAGARETELMSIDLILGRPIGYRQILQTSVLFVSTLFSASYFSLSSLRNFCPASYSV